MTDPMNTSDRPGALDAESDFCRRFVAEMMNYASTYDGTEAALRAYAEEVAPTYWAEPDQRADGPEECARADISYWEEG